MGERAPDRIALYVGGSVAAFKAPSVVTEFRRRGAEVRVAMTAGATRFVTPLTLQAVSGNPVVADLWSGDGFLDHGMNHLAAAEWCGRQVGVAVSANLIARLAMGLADDAVTAAVLACPAPLFLAPAMEAVMWGHPATQTNVATLRSRGVRFIGPVSGRLASGGEGVGRMAEPVAIVAEVVAMSSNAG